MYTFHFKMDGCTYLITGGAGFIGSHFVEVLSKNDSNHIIVFDNFSTGHNVMMRPNITYIRGDISK